MRRPGWLDWEALFLSRLSKPASDRTLYRVVVKNRPERIVELALGSLRRTERLLRFATRLRAAHPESEPGADSLSSEPGRLQYTLIDLFDARPSHLPPVGLKDVYRQLTVGRVKPRLLPGTPDEVLAMQANRLARTDLLIVSDLAVGQLGVGWFYVPRMLADGGIVLCERREARRFEVVSRNDVEQLACLHARRAVA